MKRIRALRLFNMVEVTLALATVGVGIVGIMALFPVGVNANKDAIGDNYSGDVASQLLSFIESRIKSNWATMVGTTGYPSISPPSSPPSISSTIVNGSDWTSSYGSTICDGGTNLNPASGIYGIKCGNSVSTDFMAYVRVWKTEITNFHYAGATNQSPQCTIPLDNAVRFYVEISWPIMKPEMNREKRIYCMEFFKGN